MLLHHGAVGDPMIFEHQGQIEELEPLFFAHFLAIRSKSYETNTGKTEDRDYNREEEHAAEVRDIWITDDNHEPLDQDGAQAFNNESFEQEYQNLLREDSEEAEIYEDANESFTEHTEVTNNIIHNNEDIESEVKAHLGYIPHYGSRAEAVVHLKKNLLRVSETWLMRLERPDPVWNKNCIEDVLTAAWKFGLPFQLFLPESETRLFADWIMSRMDELALPKLYGLGFTERFLTKVNGSQAQYAAWVASASEVVRCPNAVVFIVEGGIVSKIAQVIDPTLIHRFVKGPSVQITEFSKGEKFLQRDPPEGERCQFFTADCVSEVEILILLGHIPGENSDKDCTLFPLPASCYIRVGKGQKAGRRKSWKVGYGRK
ncbi:hypothetical protein DFH08DRAFT_809374 [Mycena albidolilacea]|uniref:Uncharacterized protein n=1 Tax=Mycena albidolilacea TaxID=1033008 RepID=A0AAD6ZZA3_9AGAR|nr:hypothetical protein DFH08DRAFT_809374 [Mycena albidolilacea]